MWAQIQSFENALAISADEHSLIGKIRSMGQDVIQGRLKCSELCITRIAYPPCRFSDTLGDSILETATLVRIGNRHRIKDNACRAAVAVVSDATVSP